MLAPENQPVDVDGLLPSGGCTRPSIVRRAAHAVADLILPPTCHVCHARTDAHHTVCPGCWRAVRFIHPPLCDRLGIPLPYDTGGRQVSAAALAAPPVYDRARAAAHFAGPVRHLVHHLKYQDRMEVRTLLARWMVGAGGEILDEADLVVPVPLAYRRLVWRRFNQAAVLAQEVSRLSQVPICLDALDRIRATPAQVGLSERQRKANVRGAFAVRPARQTLVAGRRVVVVDDVVTTGATVNACARALKRAGASQVDVLAVALATATSRALDELS